MYDIMRCILTHVMHIVKFAIAISLAINVFLLLYYMFTSCTVGIFITMILIIFQYPKVDGQSYVIFICMVFLHCIVLLNQNIVPNCKELFLHIPTTVVHLKLLYHLTGTNLQVLMCPPITELLSRIGDIEEVTTSPDTKDANASYICEFYRQLNISGFCPEDETTLDIPIINKTEIEIICRLAVAAIPPNNTFACYPRADPMAPCEDLLGSWALRVLIWVVFVVTLW